MTGTLTFRTFATAFKLEAVQRMEGGATVAALSRKLHCQPERQPDYA